MYRPLSPQRYRRPIAVIGVAALTIAGVLVAGDPASRAVAAGSTPVANGAARGASQPTVEQALARAAVAGRAVAVVSATTPTQTVTANPDGSVTVTSTPAPVRKRVNGVWAALDATLHTNDDGTVSPAVTTGSLMLSGGGDGPFATLSGQGSSVALTLPMSLPTPTLSGASATYTDVLPGVDVVATASVQGGVSEVLVVHNAAAAANPLLSHVTFATTTHALTLHADTAGNITGVNPAGTPLLTASAALMWDSTTADEDNSATRVTESTDPPIDPVTGQPTVSSPQGPGEGARVAPMQTTVTASAITLTPDPTLMGGVGPTYPLFYDPTYTSPNITDKNTGWATINKTYHTQNYWDDTPDPDKHLQVGDTVNDGSPFVSRSLLKFPIESAYSHTGSVISSAILKTTEVYSWSCSARVIDVYAPSQQLTQTNADWDDWVNEVPGSAAASADVAYGYDSGCPAHDIGFSVTTAVRAAVGDSSITFLLKAASETDNNGYKEFAKPTSSSPSLSVTYDNPPATPANLSTSPSTNCSGSPMTAVGDTAVTLNASVSDPDGGSVGVTFKLWKTDTPATIIDSTDPATTTVTPPSRNAAHIVPVTTLESAANGTATTFSWNVQTTDTTLSSPVSDTCTFTFDPNRPTAQPNIVPVPDAPASGFATIGQPITIVVNPPTTGPPPTSYTYQLNAGAPASVNADPDGSGVGHITVTPTRFTNTLTVAGLISGNYGPSAPLIFNAQGPTNADADGDLDGDGRPDLLTVGDTNGLPAGLWLASGTGIANPSTTVNATNLGITGVANLAHTPADFDGAQVLTGHFAGTGMQDAMIYYPQGTQPGDLNPGSANILLGTGDGSPLSAANEQNLDTSALADLNNLSPLQLAAVGDLSGSGDTAPDLIATNGSPSAGYYLDYYINPGLSNYQASELTTDTPGSTPNTPEATAWNDWTISSCLCAGTTDPTAALFLWNHTTGDLYLWEGLSLSTDWSQLIHTDEYKIATGWHTNDTNLHMQTADINDDGVPDLWTVDTGTGGTNTTTANLVTTGTTPSISAQPDEELITSDHLWPLNDNNSTSPLTATDLQAGTSFNLVATGTGATWNTGDDFNPDIAFDPTTNGALSTTTNAVVTNTDFSVSAWVNPTAGTTGDQAILSQDATTQSGFALRYLATTRQWSMSVATADTSGWNVHTATGPSGAAIPGLWTHLTGVYDSVHSIIKLYANDILIATATHTKQANPITSHSFVVGRDQQNAVGTDYFNGHIAQIQTWSQTITPGQYVSPAGYYQPVNPTRMIDTRDGTGGITGPVAANSVITLNVFATGSPIPTSTPVNAVALTLTTVSETDHGYLTVYPSGTPRPLASNVNYIAGQDAANFAIVPVPDNGIINIANASNGTTQILGDIVGYFTTDATATNDATYTPITASRFLDTRTTTGGHNGKLTGGTALTLTIGGVNAVPTGITAVAVNLTATGHTSSGHLIAYPADKTQPGTSNLQYTTTTGSGMTIVPITAGNNQIKIYSNITTDVVADVVGYFTPNTTGLKYHSIHATRLLDTRQTSPIGAGEYLALAQPTEVLATNPILITNATVTNGSSSGFINAYADGTTEPTTTTSATYAAGLTTSNLTFGPTSPTGATVDYRNHSSGTVELIIDCTGYFSTTS